MTIHPNCAGLNSLVNLESILGFLSKTSFLTPCIAFNIAVLLCLILLVAMKIAKEPVMTLKHQSTIMEIIRMKTDN